MTRVREHDDRERGEYWNYAASADHADMPTVRHCIFSYEMGDDENDEVADRYESDDRGVLQGVEAAEKR